MYRKNNPWLSLVALLLLALILVLTCTGCAAKAQAAEPDRFTVENAGNGCAIITDTETGVQYLYFYHSYNSYKGGSGMTKLEG